MQQQHQRDTTTPADMPLFKVLAELAGVMVLLLGVKTMDFVRSAARPQTQDASPPNHPATARHMARPMPPLQWRRPWWAWQLLSWVLTTMTAPTVMLIGSLLLINSRSDHPLFWWSLPVIVAVGNATAILRINQLHQRDPFTDLRTLARRHAVVGTLSGATLFLFAGWVSGFLPDIATPVSSAGLTIAFSMLSFPYAGAVHAGLGFQVTDGWRQRAATTSDQGGR